MATPPNEPTYLPPRKPKSTPDLRSKRSSRFSSPNHFPPRRPTPTASPSLSRSSTIRRDIDAVAGADDRPWTASSSGTHVNPVTHASRLAAGNGVARHSSLRFESGLSRSLRKSIAPAANMDFSQSHTSLERPGSRPRSHPPSRTNFSFFGHGQGADDQASSSPPPPLDDDVWRLPPLQQPSISRSSSQHSTMMRPKPKPSFTRLQSLDNLIMYKEEKAEWKRASSLIQSGLTDSDEQHYYEREPTIRSEPDTVVQGADQTIDEKAEELETARNSPSPSEGDDNENVVQQPKSRFRHSFSEVGFCFTIAMTQFLAEYMISGFAIELPKILKIYGQIDVGPGSMGTFWPASLLSLILSATLLVFARISDMYGGYLPFMFGVIWLGIWSIIAGFASSFADGSGIPILDVARAMQGLAIAAFIPSTFSMIGCIYTEGPRKNLVLGLYAGCAPLGFFAGFLVAGALPDNAPGWYFWIAAILSFITAVTAYLTVPHDRTNREMLGLKMDWLGSFLITGGLILVAYALAVEPYANQFDPERSGWTFPMVLGPLISGLGCLCAAFWVEGWRATCPLLPFEFFRPKSVKAFSLACLCFYASYGVWLYESAGFFGSDAATGVQGGIQGVTLAAWYTPTAVGGLILCVVGGAMIHMVPVMMLLLISALAWIGAPLLLALCPLPMNYWAFVMPSMLCATIGIDLTFTVSTIFLSAVSPLRHQGLAGAVSSILVNLAMSFSLSISEIVAVKAESTGAMPLNSSDAVDESAYAEIWGYQAAFIYAAGSAGLGLIICVLFVRISRKVVKGEKESCHMIDVERPRATSSEVSTLVEVPRA
ncbi:hypothetical protein AC578_278 [Pseudocercospora eumusae]|uniref:Major facilitator superfamily (MFS) profile domain-containing protein n=1 Tax=Pseudocercospora eumusae TaxID=321146 RepID=A0A139H742_9PEZI|nr:hypothetical protein AC578_278 [Pseudocercospora eumusae]